MNSFVESSTEDTGRDVVSMINRLMSDSSSPYYLHYGDQLISVTLENYAAWSRAGIMALSVKNKEGFIDGYIIKPYQDDPLFTAEGGATMWFPLRSSIQFLRNFIQV